MKKIALIIIIMSTLILNTGCDSGLEIIGISIEKYPESIVYILGSEDELNLSGGTINLISKDGTNYIEAMSNDEIEVSHNIDFNKPGVYVVTLKRGEFSCNFPVQVIDESIF